MARIVLCGFLAIGILAAQSSAPVITSISPDFAPLGSSGAAVTITGSNFAADSVPGWNGQQHGGFLASSTEAHLFLHNSDLLSTGTFQVSVLSPTAGPSNQMTFLVTPDPAFPAGGVVDGASFQAGQPLTAGSIYSLFGTNFLPLGRQGLMATAFPLPTTLDGVGVVVGNIDAPVLYAGFGQINFIVPWNVSSPSTIRVSISGLSTQTQSFSVAPAAPGLFALNQIGSGQGAILIAGTNGLIAGSFPGRAGRAVHRGEYLEIYATGLGAVNSPPADGQPAPATTASQLIAGVTVTIDGMPAAVSYAGLAPGLAGIYQVNVLVGASVSSGTAVPVVVSAGGIASNPVTIGVE